MLALSHSCYMFYAQIFTT